MSYDTLTGLPLTTTDANGQVTQMQYNDPLLRPTRVIPPNGGAVSEMIYNDTPGAMWVKTRTQIDGTNWKEAIAYVDGLGRTIKTQSIDNQGDVFSEMVYDNMGRAYLSSNPYRTSETKYWTQTNFDVAGRPKEIITPDGAKVQTNYDVSTSGMIGTVTTVTDQANKQRRSVTNALGQLMRVDEPDDSGNLGSIASPMQATFYSYDTLSNLVQVNQGVQQRNFSYNSLSRLLTATNPESGTINYGYDASGNLTQKTDARGVVTNYVYDNVNRVVNRTYNDGTPNVIYKYDNLQFAKGRLIQVASSISTTNYTNFDNLGKVLNSQQITDGQTYNFGYSYNLSGALVNETYPSGRIVTNNFESDGDLAQVNGSFQSQNKTYVGNLSYTSAGAVSSLQLGNGKWENTVFNSRLQPIQIGLGSSQNAQDLWKVNYDYGNADNNGNVKSQTITVPSQFTAIQNYSYDSLNRLKSANETISGNQTWKQTFTFDHYGNRKFDASQTTTLGNCPINICNPDISQTNNRVIGHAFDNSGNTTIDGEGKTFFYDAENKQKEVRNSSNQIIGQYLYDGDGKRVKKIAANDTTTFVYDAGGRLASEYLITASQSQAPTTSYLTNDTLGSPRVVTDNSGNVTSRRDFRPYGEEIYRAGQGTDKVRQKFTSYERDNETELDFAQARFYNSKSGRFNSTDPLLSSGRPINPKTWNRYAYSLNNPLRFVDPTGLVVQVSDPEEQAKKVVYIFVTLPKEDQTDKQSVTTTTTQGKKVTKKTFDVTVVSAPNFEGLAKNAPSDTEVKVFTGENATLENFQNALKDENAAGVVFFGHIAGDYNESNVYEGTGGVVLNDGIYDSDSKVDVKAKTVALFGCDSKSSANLVQSESNTVIAVDSGGNGLTSATSNAKAAFAASKSIISGKSPDQVTQQANSALVQAASPITKTVNGSKLVFNGHVANDKRDKVIRIQ